MVNFVFVTAFSASIITMIIVKYNSFYRILSSNTCCFFQESVLLLKTVEYIFHLLIRLFVINDAITYS